MDTSSRFKRALEPHCFMGIGEAVLGGIVAAAGAVADAAVAVGGFIGAGIDAVGGAIGGALSDVGGALGIGDAGAVEGGASLDLSLDAAGGYAAEGLGEAGIGATYGGLGSLGVGVGEEGTSNFLGSNLGNMEGVSNFQGVPEATTGNPLSTGATQIGKQVASTGISDLTASTPSSNPGNLPTESLDNTGATPASTSTFGTNTGAGYAPAAVGAGTGAALSTLGSTAGSSGGSSLLGGLGTSLLGSGVSALGNVIASNNAAAAQNKAAGTVAAAANNATAVQWNEFLQNQANLQPWLTAGQSALDVMTTGLQPGGKYASTPGLPTYGMDEFQKDPLYQLMQNSQSDILAQNRAGAASGGSLGSGAQMTQLQKDAAKNAEGYYQQGYNNNLTAYGATLNQQTTDWNRLAGLSGVGQTTGTQIGALGANTANQVSNIGTNAANTIAGTQINAGNAISGGIAGVGNALTSGLTNYQNQQNQSNLMNLLSGAGNNSGVSADVSGAIPSWNYSLGAY